MFDSPLLVFAIYLILPLIFLLNARKSIKKNFFYWLSCAFLVWLAASRTIEIGSDTVSYHESYEYKTYLLTNQFELSWIVICTLGNWMQWSFHELLAVMSLLALVPLYIVISKVSKRPYMSLFLYITTGFYFLSFNIMRQTIAISFFALAVVYFWEKSYLKTTFSALVAVAFHYTCFLMFPILFFIPLLNRFSHRFKVKLLFLTLGTGFLFSNVVNWLMSFLPFEKYAVYSDYAVDKNANILALFLVNVLVNMQCYLCIRERKWTVLTNIYYASVVLVNIFGYNIGINRFIYYLSVFSILAIPEIIAGQKYRYSNLAVYVVFYNLFFYIFSILRNTSGVFPY